MNSVNIVEPNDLDRGAVESFIQEIYHREYRANVERFPDQIICRTGPSGEIKCVAGFRLASDGFFSEQYLDDPIEAVLARITGRHVRRDEVFEVTTLASRSPREIETFIDDIIAVGARNGFSWSFFTLTRRLSRFVRRRSLALIHLADADPRRVADAASWGRYYETDPKVYGVCGIEFRQRLAPSSAEARDAHVL
jgi:hypothetical protein